MSIEISKKLFTVHDYHRMVDAGILFEGESLELIHGEVLKVIPGGPRHDAAVLRATQLLTRLLSNRAIVGIRGTVRLDEYDEPQPDIYLLKPKDDFYASGHAGPRDILLIIEMADSSLAYDESIKLQLFAETGIPEYWIADIRNDRLIAYSEIRDKTYSVRYELHRGDSVVPQRLPGFPIPVDALLP